jgi:membrane-associated phospholipid phosphatase
MSRSTRDLAGLGIGVGILVGTAALARRPISRTEVEAFRTVNDLPGVGFPVIWLPMQYGTFGTVPASAVLTLARNRPRLALAIGVGGTTAWLSAKALKRLVGRGRPASVIDDVLLRGVEEGDLGFPSGHAAVSAALTVVALPSVTGGWRWSLAALSGFVPLARMYVGAHLPLDVVGGSALGLAIGSAVNLLIPTRREAESPTERCRSDRPRSTRARCRPSTGYRTGRRTCRTRLPTSASRGAW